MFSLFTTICSDQIFILIIWAIKRIPLKLVSALETGSHTSQSTLKTKTLEVMISGPNFYSILNSMLSSHPSFYSIAQHPVIAGNIRSKLFHYPTHLMLLFYGANMSTSFVYLDIACQSITAILCRISVSIASMLLLEFYNNIFCSKYVN